MELSRAIRKSISLALMGVLLFAQLAVASYSCPRVGGMDPASMSVSMPELMTMSMPELMSVGMAPGCDQLDPEAANLCAEHCHQGQQSADTAAPPAVSAAIPTLLYLIPIEPQHVPGSGRSAPAVVDSVVAAPEPPHAILHCVFRT